MYQTTLLLLHLGCVAHLYFLFNSDLNDAVCDARKAKYLFQSPGTKNN